MSFRNKIKALGVFSIFGCSVCFMSGCYYDSEEYLYGMISCDTLSEVSYSLNIAPLMDEYCNVCHATGSALGGVILDNYESVMSEAISGNLYGAISHGEGFTAMPKNSTKLDDCTISKVKQWIDNGTLDN